MRCSKDNESSFNLNEISWAYILKYVTTAEDRTHFSVELNSLDNLFL